MKNGYYAITSESVSEGHPDKICDQISDAVLDNLLSQDPYSRVAVETMAARSSIIVAGEVTSAGFADIDQIVRNTLKEIGYTKPQFGIDHRTIGVLAGIVKQSPDISMGVGNDPASEIGAGDQGLMYGYACDETPQLMPLPIILAHDICRLLAEARKKNTISGIGPDGKSQVTVVYSGNEPCYIDNIVVAQQHLKSKNTEELKKEITEKIIIPVCEHHLGASTKFFINTTGRFVLGGPQADTGVTGRKIIVDTYGGIARHGGGAFSGKDPTKVDRSAAYMARYAAKNIVAAGLAKKCEIRVCYVIGKAEPLSIGLECFETETRETEKIIKAVQKTFDFRPKAIIETLNLRRPIYQKTAAYGHFGRHEDDFTLENTNKTEELLNNL